MVPCSKISAKQALVLWFVIHMGWSLMSEQIPLTNSVAEVEAIAAVKAVNFAQELCFSLVVFEGASKVVIRALCSEDESYSSYGHLIF